LKLEDRRRKTGNRVAGGRQKKEGRRRKAEGRRLNDEG